VASQLHGGRREIDVPTRPTRAVRAAALALALLLLAACSHSGSPRPAPAAVTLAYCGGRPQARPTVVSIICRSDDITAGRLSWSGWGRPTATAVGTAVVDLCAFEDCHSGQYSPFPIVVIASRITRCPGHRPAYSRLQYVFVGTSPFQDVPADVSFKNYIVGADRPAPPRDQTVSLSCA
jgi:hypothetical protein